MSLAIKTQELGLDDMPLEMVWEIASYLDVYAYVMLALTCPSFYRLLTYDLRAKDPKYDFKSFTYEKRLCLLSRLVANNQHTALAVLYRHGFRFYYGQFFRALYGASTLRQYPSLTLTLVGPEVATAFEDGWLQQLCRLRVYSMQDADVARIRYLRDCFSERELRIAIEREYMLLWLCLALMLFLTFDSSPVVWYTSCFMCGVYLFVLSCRDTPHSILDPFLKLHVISLLIIGLLAFLGHSHTFDLSMYGLKIVKFPQVLCNPWWCMPLCLLPFVPVLIVRYTRLIK